MPSRPQALDMAKFKVFFPMYVTINNPRLGVLFWIVMVVTVGIAVYQFIADKRDEIEKLPDGDVQVCSQLCQLTQAKLISLFAASPIPAGAAEKDYAHACSATSSIYKDSCMTAAETVQYGASSVFIPTKFEQKEADYGGCPMGRCGSNIVSQHYYVRGVEKQFIEFSHHYSAPKPTSALFGDKPDVVGSSLKDLKTIVIKGDGSKMTEFAPGERIRLTVQEILENVWIDDLNANWQALKLDDMYENQPERTGNVKLRDSGMIVTFDFFYTNTGQCRINLEYDAIDTEAGDNEGASCLVMKATRKNTQKTQLSYTTYDGSSRTRIYSGIEINFHAAGSFKFRDMSRVFRGLTTILIWMQIPIWILYFFSILFLGQLSAIYNRVIHQEISLKDAIVGLAGRLISHSSSFQDVQDDVNGITKQRILERFSLIMQYNEDLDSTEVAKFVDFVYKSMAVADDKDHTAHSSDSSKFISVQDFCAACSTNEPLTFDALVQIFDQQRELGLFESMFNDDVILQIRNAGARQEMIDAVQQTTYKHAGNRASMGPSKHVLDIPQRYATIQDETGKASRDIATLLQKHEKLTKYIKDAEQELSKAGSRLDLA